MSYNFETVPKRYNIGCAKYDELEKYDPSYKEMDIIPFSSADMEFETAPAIKEGLKKYLDTYSLGYILPFDRQKESVCRWMRRRHGWDIQPEWLLGTHGVQEAFFGSVKLFTEPGDGVILMTPCYYPMYAAITRNGRVVVENRMIYTGTKYEVDFDDLEQKASQKSVKLLILCSPHNPTSRVFTREELTRIGVLQIKVKP